MTKLWIQISFDQQRQQNKRRWGNTDRRVDGGGTCSGWGQGRRSVSRDGPLTSTSDRSLAPPASNTPTDGPGPGDSALRTLGGKKRLTYLSACFCSISVTGPACPVCENYIPVPRNNLKEKGKYYKTHTAATVVLIQIVSIRQKNPVKTGLIIFDLQVQLVPTVPTEDDKDNQTCYYRFR